MKTIYSTLAHALEGSTAKDSRKSALDLSSSWPCHELKTQHAQTKMCEGREQLLKFERICFSASSSDWLQRSEKHLRRFFHSSAFPFGTIFLCILGYVYSPFILSPLNCMKAEEESSRLCKKDKQREQQYCQLNPRQAIQYLQVCDEKEACFSQSCEVD